MTTSHECSKGVFLMPSALAVAVGLAGCAQGERSRSKVDPCALFGRSCAVGVTEILGARQAGGTSGS